MWYLDLEGTEFDSEGEAEAALGRDETQEARASIPSEQRWPEEFTALTGQQPRGHPQSTQTYCGDDP